MKKNFITTLLMSAASMLVALTFTACGEEVIIDNNDNGGITVKPGQTLFSTGGGETRTSMDAERYFYWESGDKIWVKTAENTYQPSTSSTIGTQTQVAACNFVLDASLTSQTYPVFYIGQNSPEASQTTANSLHVTIANNQTQSAWNKSEHLGMSGDCGTATATRYGNGTYGFQLLHRASYLVIYPYTPEATGCTLTEIEITSDNTIAGTYPFGADGLNTSTVTSPSNTIKLMPKAGSTFTMDNTSGKHLFAVIQPGTHSLILKCTFKDASNQPFTKTRYLNRTFNENGVTEVNFPLSASNIDPEFEFTFENTFYMWDAKTWLFEDIPAYPPTTGYDNNFILNYDLIAHTSWFNPTEDDNPTSNSSAVFSAKGMPCYNAMTWYGKEVFYYDETTEWTMNGMAKTGGWWVKKWDYISEKPDGSTPYNCPTESGKAGAYSQRGKPDASVIDQYFFLPALGTYVGNNDNRTIHQYYTGTTYFFSSSPRGYMHVGRLILPTGDRRQWGFSTVDRRAPSLAVAGTRPDGSPWFK